MMDAIAGALVLGGVNTIADVVAAQLKLGDAGIYPVGRILLACYCVGGLIGLQSRQLLIGTLSGLMLGTLVGGLYVVLAPSLGAGAAWLAWAAFWLGFAGCEAVLRGESGPVSAAIQGVALRRSRARSTTGSQDRGSRRHPAIHTSCAREFSGRRRS